MGGGQSSRFGRTARRLPYLVRRPVNSGVVPERITLFMNKRVISAAELLRNLRPMGCKTGIDSIARQDRARYQFAACRTPLERSGAAERGPPDRGKAFTAWIDRSIPEKLACTQQTRVRAGSPQKITVPWNAANLPGGEIGKPTRR
jgi:hypothetical protein